MEDTAFKEMFIPIVRDALIRDEGKGQFGWAARFALALDDKVSEERLIRKILFQKDIDPWEYKQAGLLAIATGDFGLAEQLIRELEKNIGDWQVDEAIVDIAIRLPNKTTARRVMLLFEERDDEGEVLNIAAAIEDRVTSERLIKKWLMRDGYCISLKRTS